MSDAKNLKWERKQGKEVFPIAWSDKCEKLQGCVRDWWGDGNADLDYDKNSTSCCNNSFHPRLQLVSELEEPLQTPLGFWTSVVLLLLTWTQSQIDSIKGFLWYKLQDFVFNHQMEQTIVSPSVYSVLQDCAASIASCWFALRDTKEILYSWWEGTNVFFTIAKKRKNTYCYC